MTKHNPNDLNDDTIMSWGKHRDKRFGDIPDDYWRWFLGQDWCDKYPNTVRYANLVFEDE